MKTDLAPHAALNECHTRECLQKLFDRLMAAEAPEEIMPHAIEKLLNADDSGTGYADETCLDYLLWFYRNGRLLPELTGKDLAPWNSKDEDRRIGIIRSEYREGNWFHVGFNPEADADEWMALNCKSQRTVAAFLAAMLSDTAYDGSPLKDCLFSARIYAAGSPEACRADNEKLTLFYPQKEKERIRRYVALKLKGETLPRLNAFRMIHTLTDQVTFATGQNRGQYTESQRYALAVARFLSGAPDTDWEEPIPTERIHALCRNGKESFVTACYDFVLKTA